jgi:hypothetical protein
LAIATELDATEVELAETLEEALEFEEEIADKTRLGTTLEATADFASADELEELDTVDELTADDELVLVAELALTSFAKELVGEVLPTLDAAT